MIDELKPYADYKDFGSRWIAAVPSHWDVRNLRTLIRHRNERDRPELPLLSVAREKGVFVRSLTNADENHNVIPEDLTNYKVARAGNLVINKMKAWQGSMGIAPCDGIVSPAYFVYDFAIANRAFGQTLLRSKPYVAHFGQASDGVRVGQWDLTISGMRNIPVVQPPPDEQAAIVRFLDYANSGLERAIRAKRKVIALLNEQKQAIIHRAVTRGLDPTAPLKPSGIAWLGDIPAHWEVMQLRQVLSFGPKNGISPPAPSTGGVLSFSISAVRDGRVRVEGNEKRVDLDAGLVGGLKIREGDILLVRGNGNVALVGKCGLVENCPDDCVYPDILMKMRPNERMAPAFLVAAINSEYISSQVSTLAKTANGAFKVSGATVRSLLVVVPPLSEQKAILDRVAADASEVNTAITRLEREIALLREYRTRLVADVVTGKLDVRPAAARLPAEPLAAVAVSDLPQPDVDEVTAELDQTEA